MSLAYRHPYAKLDEEPITRGDVDEFRRSLTRFWEDTQIVTKPNGISIITVGALLALCDTLLTCKDFDDPQMMMGRKP